MQPVRVAMSVEQCWQHVPGGSGEYIAELSSALAVRDDVAVRGFAARHPQGEVPDPAPTGPVTFFPLPRPLLYESWARTRRPRVGGDDVDVVHATTWAVPGHRVPLVVTVHDLAFERDPAQFTARGADFFRRALRIAMDEAAQVIVPSRATADDCRAAGFDEARLTVIPHGVRADDVSADQVASWRVRRGVSREYLLWSGTLEPRKNVARLVRAFSAARREGLRRDLVLVGPSGWGDRAEVAAAVAEAPEGSVHLLGRLSRGELQIAYAGAWAFAFPSLWEGFGMPVLEAMAHGVPVLTSAGTSMAEFADGVGALVDPLDVEGMAGALVEGFDGVDRAGVRRRAEAFTWEASAASHADVYRRAAG